MTGLTLLERRLRLTTGLILAVYIIVHLSNHTLGLISLAAMEAMREIVTPLWRSWPGFVLIYGSILTHFGLALMSLYRRTTLKMPAWEMLQLVLGLSIIPLLASHVAGSWGGRVLMGVEVNYEYALRGILGDSWVFTRQTMLVMVAWAHVVIGLHFVLRLFSGYPRWKWHLYPLVILMPLLVVLSLIRVGYELEIWQSEPVTLAGGTVATVVAKDVSDGPRASEVFRDSLLYSYFALLFLTLVARAMRATRRQEVGSVTIRHENGRELKGRPGQTILEILRKNGIPHASLCGGRGRCTTCRVRVGEGYSELETPSTLEQFALERIGAAANVRLACQTRPLRDLQITPLLPPDLGVDSKLSEGGVSGEEREVVAMFVDLRGSTHMGELHLPYDVLFILNRFFLEMSEALSASHGHYAQFAGDGLMALYGLDRGLKQGCLDALRGAVEMQQRINQLNERLKTELKQPLRIGIGIHCGEAIVGTMGPPKSPNFSAIGDCINAAARLEGKSKELDGILVVSDAVIRASGIEFSRFPTQEVSLRGKQQSILAYVVKNPLQVADCF